MCKSNLLLGMLLVSFSFFSQTEDETTKNKIKFGFNFGLNYATLSDFGFKKSLDIENGFGFRLGIISEIEMSKKWFLSPKAELSFNKSVLFENNVGYRVMPQNLNFMFHFKHIINEFDNLNPYIYFGPNIWLPIEKENNLLTYQIKPTFGLDFGFGTDIELKHYKIAPELRFSVGLNEIRKNPTEKLLLGSNAALIVNFSSK